MKKHHLLLALMAIFAVVFAGCGTDKGVETAGPEDNMGYEDVSGGDELGNPESGHMDASNASWGKFSPIHFDTDSASVRAGDRATLKKVGDYLNNNPGSKVLVAGNCDDRGTSEYNRALGQRRAQAARNQLIKQGVSADRISTVSYGEDKPVGDWAQNRRDDFGIID